MLQRDLVVTLHLRVHIVFPATLKARHALGYATGCVKIAAYRGRRYIPNTIAWSAQGGDNKVTSYD
jgi:hypothetical protein